MKGTSTLILLLAFVTAGHAYDKKKPQKCTPYGCDDWAWKQKKNAFDPHTIKWPLHHTGETILDRIDGGHHDIDVVFGHYGKKHRIGLKDYRNSTYHPDPWFLDEGLDMKPPFICEPWLDEDDKPWWTDNKCSMVEATYEDKHVYVDGPSCSKIIRTWTVIDWCKWEPNGYNNTRQEKYALVKDIDHHKVYWAYGKHPEDVEHDGWYTFDQVIKIIDKDEPVMANCDDIEIEIEGSCTTIVKVKNKAVDTGRCPGEKMEVEFVLKDEDGKVILSKWLWAKHDEEFQALLGHLEAGYYKIHWTVTDGCGNKSECYQNLKVIDRNPPNLICYKDLSTKIGRDGQVSIWAKDFVHKIEGPCYDGHATVSFAADSLVMSQTFDCDGGVGVNEMEIYVTGSNGVQVSCNVTLAVGDQGVCDAAGMAIVGRVSSFLGQRVADAEVVIEAEGNYVSSGMSNESGAYAVGGITYDLGRPVIKGTVHETSTRGLDNYDMIHILRHAMDIEKLPKVEQRAAADMNLDGQVDMTDYVYLQEVIYDIPGYEIDYEPWKFYSGDLQFINFSDHMDLLKPVKLMRFKFAYDITALKSGDVDFSWRNQEVATNRSRTMSSSFEQGDHRVDISLPNTGQLLHSVMLDISDNSLISSVQVNGKDVSYEIMEHGGGQQLVVLATQQLAGGKLSIAGDVSVLGTGLLFAGTIEEGSQFEWRLSETSEDMLIAPNPTEDHFTITIGQKTTQSATLELYNVQGQRVLQQYESLAPGKNVINVSTGELQSGVYMVMLATSEDVTSQRIVKN